MIFVVQQYLSSHCSTVQLNENTGQSRMKYCLQISLRLEFLSQNTLGIYPFVRRGKSAKKNLKKVTDNKTLKMTVQDFCQVGFLLNRVSLACFNLRSGSIFVLLGETFRRDGRNEK